MFIIPPYEGGIGSIEDIFMQKQKRILIIFVLCRYISFQM
jgi:hypothetical protein